MIFSALKRVNNKDTLGAPYKNAGKFRALQARAAAYCLHL